MQTHNLPAALTFNLLIITLKPESNEPSYSNTVIGTLAVDGWAVSLRPLLPVPNVTAHPSIDGRAVTFHTARRGLGGLRPRPVPFSLYKLRIIRCSTITAFGLKG